jgi:hypothetical protein
MSGRLETFGVEVVKALGQKFPVDHAITRISTYNGILALSREEQEVTWGVLEELVKPTIFARDPDGNTIEIQPTKLGLNYPQWLSLCQFVTWILFILGASLTSCSFCLLARFADSPGFV